MRKLLFAALLIALPASAATVLFEDGTQVEIPEDWEWNISAHCTLVPEDVPIECSVYPWAPQCPGSCDGPTPHSICSKEPVEPPVLIDNVCGGPDPDPRCRTTRSLTLGAGS